jgi:hypothetical protein
VLHARPFLVYILCEHHATTRSWCCYKLYIRDMGACVYVCVCVCVCVCALGVHPKPVKLCTPTTSPLVPCNILRIRYAEKTV